MFYPRPLRKQRAAILSRQSAAGAPIGEVALEAHAFGNPKGRDEAARFACLESSLNDAFAVRERQYKGSNISQYK
jgi:hypothetical protein